MPDYFNSNYTQFEMNNFDLTNTLNLEFNSSYISEETNQRNSENVNTGIETLLNGNNKNESIKSKTPQKK
jgi:hypothetical protein